MLAVGGRCDWGKEDLFNSPFWGLELTPTDLKEIESALAFCKANGLELQVRAPQLCELRQLFWRLPRWTPPLSRAAALLGQLTNARYALRSRMVGNP
eukprot:scaffold2363_cov403-Prasinococcus_capsulatus_cf.AAC.3